MTMPAHSFPPPHYAPPAPRNGLGLTALILGLVALPFTLTGLTAWLAIILGIIAVPLALAGLGRVRRRTASNKGVTITGLVLGLVAITLGITSTVVMINAVGEAFSGPSAVTYTGTQATEVTGPVQLGQVVTVDGLTVMVSDVVSRTDVGKSLTCAEVAYANPGDDVAHRNPMDWSARNTNGASVGSWLYTGKDALHAGELAPGGSSDTGTVCFDMPRGDVAVIEYKGSIFSSGPDAEWAVS